MKLKWDHPRGCGENGVLLPLYMFYMGSPPRMRGKRLVCCACVDVNGDHPRGCGENRDASYHSPRIRGSPPRMRGKPRCKLSQPAYQRITPADAGKTDAVSVNSCMYRDHPRGCGENAVKCQHHQCLPGSPPRMRGKLVLIAAFYVRHRITPADAGKTLLSISFKRRQQDHPRGCGENFRCQIFFVVNHGSPPRMRGKPCCFAVQLCPAGITPADAGKTA